MKKLLSLMMLSLFLTPQVQAFTLVELVVAIEFDSAIIDQIINLSKKKSRRTISRKAKQIARSLNRDSSISKSYRTRDIVSISKVMRENRIRTSGIMRSSKQINKLASGIILRELKVNKRDFKRVKKLIKVGKLAAVGKIIMGHRGIGGRLLKTFNMQELLVVVAIVQSNAVGGLIMTVQFGGGMEVGIQK